MVLPYNSHPLIQEIWNFFPWDFVVPWFGRLFLNTITFPFWLLSLPVYWLWNFLPETSGLGLLMFLTVFTPCVMLLNAATAFVTFGGIIFFPLSGSWTVIFWFLFSVFVVILAIVLGVLGGLGLLKPATTTTA